ncbi:ABC transporter substrate-binding protein [Halomonas sp. PR-M31]|uniref:ABC transporter substrate-binding protein n=1 Tax=Halomonas sp. PR-M31 TaxID=1471202 RepID=UPI0009E3867F|nr:ABC transporter substrate-binding protein [Halomonas sp. PR-M31]
MAASSTLSASFVAQATFRARIRGVLAALLLLLASTLPARAAESSIVTLDWTVAETMLALGVVPQGVAQLDAYRDWVGSPEMPASVVDLGLRAQPNLELLADLDPSDILITPLFASLEPRLSRIAPVTTLGIYATSNDPWASMLAATRKLGRLTGRPEAAERLIASTETQLAQAKKRLPENSPALLVVQFMDERHVRVFGERSLFQGVLSRLGLDNAWQEKTNTYGFSLVGLEDLAELKAHLVVVEPLPTGVEEQLAESGLWQNLDAVRRHQVSTLPPVWSFGALPSAQRFTHLLVKALTPKERAEDV